MSISTRRGDGGETDLMFGRRVRKTDPVVGAIGAVDELNAALGVVRVFCEGEETGVAVAEIQEQLIGLMGVLSTAEADEADYCEKGYRGLGRDEIDYLDGRVAHLEREDRNRFSGWARPGGEGKAGSAFLDVARTVCRRAEREVLAVRGEGSHGAVYLNRLSDLLWLLAREEAHVEGTEPRESE